MAEKLFYQIHHQRGKRDCGVATLATLIGRTYEEVLMVAGDISPNVLKKGLFASDLAKIANEFQSTIVRKVGHIDLDEDTGILELKFPNRREHYVFLMNGLIFDPQEPGQVWDAYTYVRKSRAKVQGLSKEVE